MYTNLLKYRCNSSHVFFYPFQIDQLQDDLRDYQRQVEAQRDTMAARQDVDTEYQSKLTSKTRLLNAALDENAVSLQ